MESIGDLPTYEDTSVLKIINLNKGVGIQSIKSCETSYLYVIIVNSIAT